MDDDLPAGEAGETANSLVDQVRNHGVSLFDRGWVG
jgi:hypothetical protein